MQQTRQGYAALWRMQVGHILYMYSPSPIIRISIWDLRSENPYHEANSEVSTEDILILVMTWQHQEAKIRSDCYV